MREPIGSGDSKATTGRLAALDRWLDPGQGDAVFWAGQGANENGDMGKVNRFAILDHGGTSATGLVAWSAKRNAVDETGDCVFSAQAKG